MVNLSHNIHIAIYAMLIASFLPAIFSTIAKVLGGFKVEDNADPRTFLAHTQGMAKRAHAAHLNSYEILPFFLASVLLAMFMVVPEYVINKLVIIFIIFRILYGVAYIANMPSTRTALWLLSMACPALLCWISIQMI